MSRFTVSINSQAGGDAGLNLNVQVEAENVIEALEAAKAQLWKTIEASGLALAAAAPAAAVAVAEPPSASAA